MTDEDMRQITNDCIADIQNLRDMLRKEESYKEFRNKRRNKYLWYAVAVALAIIAGVLAAQFFDAKEFVPPLIVAFICAVAAVTWNKLAMLWE